MSQQFPELFRSTLTWQDLLNFCESLDGDQLSLSVTIASTDPVACKGILGLAIASEVQDMNLRAEIEESTGAGDELDSKTPCIVI